MFYDKNKHEIVLNKIKRVSFLTSEYILLCDVETCNDNKIILDFSYDIISTRTGVIVASGSYIIKECWQTRSLRYGKYAKSKIKNYIKKLNKKECKLISLLDLYDLINNLISSYNIKIFMAYNGKFDLEALYNTFNYSNSKMKLWQKSAFELASEQPLFMQLDLLDLWTYASKLYKTKKFKKWYDKKIAIYSSNGNRKTTAEIVGRYILENLHFIEEHTGAKDLEIEYLIFIACYFNSANRMVWLNYSGLWGVWRLAQDMVLNKDSKLYIRFILNKMCYN